MSREGNRGGGIKGGGKVQQCQVKRMGGDGRGRQISPDLLDRLPATVEEERGRQ